MNDIQFSCMHCEKIIPLEKDYLIDDEIRLCEPCTHNLMQVYQNATITSHGEQVNYLEVVTRKPQNMEAPE